DLRLPRGLPSVCDRRRGCALLRGCLLRASAGLEASGSEAGLTASADAVRHLLSPARPPLGLPTRHPWPPMVAAHFFEGRTPGTSATPAENQLGESIIQFERSCLTTVSG